MAMIELSPLAIEAAAGDPEQDMALAAAILQDAIGTYWQTVLSYESSVGMPANQARNALQHSALALRALETAEVVS